MTTPTMHWDEIAAQLGREGYCVLPQAGASDPAVLYAQLLPLARRWQAVTGPVRMHSVTTTMLPGDFQPLRQDVDGFPFQLIALASEPGVAFTGGECVLVEQRPRMQSRPVVVPLLHRGDVAIISAGRRPVTGSRGVYTVSMRHAVSPVRSGTRIAVTTTWERDHAA